MVDPRIGNVGPDLGLQVGFGGFLEGLLALPMPEGQPSLGQRDVLLIAHVRVRLGVPTSARRDGCLRIGDGARLGKDLLLRRSQAGHHGQQGLLGGEALTDQPGVGGIHPVGDGP